jgi:hypothetical protein
MCVGVWFSVDNDKQSEKEKKSGRAKKKKDGQ